MNWPTRYLRLLAEAELRRAGDQLRRLDIAAKDVWADPGMTPFRTLEGATWKVIRTGVVLVRLACSTRFTSTTSRLIFMRPSRSGQGSC